MNNNADFSNLDLNDPMVQKCLAYIKSQMNNNQMNNNQMNMNQMNMNQMNNNQMNNQMFMNQMNNNQMNNPMFMNQMYNNPMFMGVNPMQMNNMYNYCMSQMYGSNPNFMTNMNNVGGNNNFNNNNFPNNNFPNNNFPNNNFPNNNFPNNNFINNNIPNNNVPNTFNNNMNGNDNNMNISGNNLKELLPREDKTIYDSSKNINNSQNIINIALNASTGLKVIIPISITDTLEDLFKRYAVKANIPESALGTKIVFLFSGGKIDPFSKAQIGTHFKNGAIITVFDQGGIIGA